MNRLLNYTCFGFNFLFACVVLSFWIIQLIFSSFLVNYSDNLNELEHSCTLFDKNVARWAFSQHRNIKIASILGIIFSAIAVLSFPCLVVILYVFRNRRAILTILISSYLVGWFIMLAFYIGSVIVGHIYYGDLPSNPEVRYLEYAKNDIFNIDINFNTSDSCQRSVEGYHNFVYPYEVMYFIYWITILIILVYSILYFILLIPYLIYEWRVKRHEEIVIEYYPNDDVLSQPQPSQYDQYRSFSDLTFDRLPSIMQNQ